MLDHIIEALKNLGGQGTLKEIHDELERIRTPSRPYYHPQGIRKMLDDNSPDSSNFKGQDYFRKPQIGFYSLTDQTGTRLAKPKYSVSGNERKKTKTKSVKKAGVSESFETLSNILATIKEYRVYSDPNSSSWEGYIQEFFHLIGFKTTQLGSRFFSLDDIENNNSSLALLSIVKPNEDFENIIDGISWENYILFASKFYRIDWGILTDGFNLKILDCSGTEIRSTFFLSKLDEMVMNNEFETFYTVYKEFSKLRNNEQKDHTSKTTPTKQDFTRYVLNGKTYWKNQLVLQVITEWVKSNKPKNKEELFQVFPKSMHRDSLFKPVAEAREIYNRTGYKRHYINPDEIIKLPDGTEWAVTNQWSKGKAFNEFVAKTEELGFKISGNK